MGLNTEAKNALKALSGTKDGKTVSFDQTTIAALENCPSLKIRGHHI